MSRKVSSCGPHFICLRYHYFQLIIGCLQSQTYQLVFLLDRIDEYNFWACTQNCSSDRRIRWKNQNFICVTQNTRCFLSFQLCNFFRVCCFCVTFMLLLWFCLFFFGRITLASSNNKRKPFRWRQFCSSVCVRFISDGAFFLFFQYSTNEFYRPYTDRQPIDDHHSGNESLA